MAKPQLVVTTEPPTRPPERERLAAAIQQHDAAQELLTAAKAAYEQRWNMVADAKGAVTAATAAVEEAKANAAKHLSETMLGTAGATPASVKQARLALQDAEDAHEAAQAAKVAIEAQRAAAENQVSYARFPLNDAVLAVLKAEVPVAQLLSDYEILHRELVSRRRVLEFLDGLGALPKGAGFNLQSERDLSGVQGDAPWKDAVALLATSADEPLPA